MCVVCVSVAAVWVVGCGLWLLAFQEQLERFLSDLQSSQRNI